MSQHVCPTCGQQVVEPEPVEPPDLERMHLLHTLNEYPGATPTVAERYNDECAHEEFDPLPKLTVRQVAARLAHLRDDGLVTSYKGPDFVEWDLAPAGQQAVADYVPTSEAVFERLIAPPAEPTHQGTDRG